MKVTHIRIRKADGPLTVMDAFVDKGLTEGGHASLPDIDVDYASDRRQEIKDYLEERYNADGRQRVFSAGTFTTMKLKAALKDVARVHRVPHSIVNYITAMIDDGTDWTGLFRQAASNRKLRDFIQTYPLVIEDVQGLLGQPKAASIHASAIVVTPDTRDGRPAECFDFLPVRKMDGALVSEFDGYSVDEIGLLKEDVLATKELAKLSAVIALVILPEPVFGDFFPAISRAVIANDKLDVLQCLRSDRIQGFFYILAVIVKRNKYGNQGHPSCPGGKQRLHKPSLWCRVAGIWESAEHMREASASGPCCGHGLTAYRPVMACQRSARGLPVSVSQAC